MNNELPKFKAFTQAFSKPPHQFGQRNIHPTIVKECKKLFDDQHYTQATFDACMILEDVISLFANDTDKDIYGRTLIDYAFDGKNPRLQLSKLSGLNKENEQEGFLNIFRGVTTGIRNPRGHKKIFSGKRISENIDQCLDHLSLVSMLMRKLDGSQKV